MTTGATGRLPARLRLLLPLPFELVAWSALLIALVFLRSRGLNLDAVTIRYTIPPLLWPVGLGLVSGVALHTLYRLARRRPLKPYFRAVLTPAWLLLGLRIWVTCLVISYTYMWLKVSVPLINFSLWDAQLSNLDRLMHFGLSPSIFWRELLAGTGLLPWIDRWYGLWTSTIALSIGFFCAYPRPEVRRQTILATVLLWVFGAWLYLALPAVGPAFADPQVREGVRQEMPSAQNAQAALWENYQRVLAGRDGTLRRFKPAYGVAALPSLHVAGHLLLLLWVRRWARPLLVPAVLAVVATFIGSVATGWHYAVDGYAGALLALLVDRLAVAGDRWLDLSRFAEQLPGDEESRASGKA